jgi:hypothetical protein
LSSQGWAGTGWSAIQASAAARSAAASAHQRVHQAQLAGLARAEQLALQDVGLRAHQAEQARHLGDAGGAGNQAQRDLGQAELDLAVVHRDAVVAHQRHSQPPPSAVPLRQLTTGLPSVSSVRKFFLVCSISR